MYPLILEARFQRQQQARVDGVRVEHLVRGATIGGDYAERIVLVASFDQVKRIGLAAVDQFLFTGVDVDPVEPIRPTLGADSGIEMLVVRCEAQRRHRRIALARVVENRPVAGALATHHHLAELFVVVGIGEPRGAGVVCDQDCSRKWNRARSHEAPAVNIEQTVFGLAVDGAALVVPVRYRHQHALVVVAQRIDQGRTGTSRVALLYVGALVRRFRAIAEEHAGFAAISVDAVQLAGRDRSIDATDLGRNRRDHTVVVGPPERVDDVAFARLQRGTDLHVVTIDDDQEVAVIRVRHGQGEVFPIRRNSHVGGFGGTHEILHRDEASSFGRGRVGSLRRATQQQRRNQQGLHVNRSFDRDCEVQPCPHSARSPRPIKSPRPKSAHGLVAQALLARVETGIWMVAAIGR